MRGRRCEPRRTWAPAGVSEFSGLLAAAIAAVRDQRRRSTRKRGRRLHGHRCRRYGLRGRGRRGGRGGRDRGRAIRRALGLRELQAEQRIELRLDAAADIGVLLQEQPRVLAALADPFLAEREPGARLLDDALVDGEVDQLALARDPLVVEDVELGLAE